MLGAALCLTVVPGCKKTVPLSQRMAGSWRHRIDVGALASKDPVVRGLAKLWGEKPLEILLEVEPTTIEVTRWSRVEKREVVQRASYRILDARRIELRTDAGTLVVEASPGDCDDEGRCLSIRFSPEGAASSATEAMGFLFGCDDVEGKISCAGLTSYRAFYRYPKPPPGP